MVRAVRGHDEQVGHAVEQVSAHVKPRVELIASGADLIGMRSGDNRLRDRIGRIVCQSVEPDLRPLRDDIEEACMRHVMHVECALHIIFHVPDRAGSQTVHAREKARA
jgi:hypothetical protein